MAQKIESDKLLVKDVFSKWFRIPEYQRPYVWSNDQISELLDDVMQARNSNPESQYFLGSMVLRGLGNRDVRDAAVVGSTNICVAGGVELEWWRTFLPHHGLWTCLDILAGLGGWRRWTTVGGGRVEVLGNEDGCA